MKLSISLPESDVDFVDEYAGATSAESRSAVIHAAIEMLRSARLEEEYAAAWEEWDDSPDAELWDATASDGTDGASHEAR